MNSKYFQKDDKTYSTGATTTELTVHEGGHNMVEDHWHRKKISKEHRPKYGYDDIGLQSNQPTKVYPTEANTKTIINDATNRSTIRTNDCTEQPKP